MIRNRIALLGTLTIITMSLAGCGGNNSSGNSTASPAEGSNVTAEEGTGAAAGEDGAAGAPGVLQQIPAEADAFRLREQGLVPPGADEI